MVSNKLPAEGMGLALRVALEVRIFPSTPNLHRHRKAVMKKVIAVLCMLAATNVFAGMERDAYDMWSLGQVMTSSTTITLVRAKDVTEVREICDRESVKRGNGKFGHKIDACSFWDQTSRGNSCTIVVAVWTNNDTIGHETRHCFQGKFH